MPSSASQDLDASSSEAAAPRRVGRSPRYEALMARTMAIKTSTAGFPDRLVAVAESGIACSPGLCLLGIQHRSDPHELRVRALARF